jgi:hypothetical protein
MGNLSPNCNACDSSKEERDSELPLSIPGITETDPDKRRILIQSKLGFEEKLTKMGKILKNQEINQILNTVNPMVSKISFPEDITKTQKPNTFEEPIIRFHNGEIYKGNWNINHQRDGFGININPDGEVYIGLWNNDQIGDYGAFFDNEGNYYKGNLINGKGNGQGEICIFNKMKYIGEFVDDIPNGKGYMINLMDGSEYNGNIINGKKEGKGLLKFKDGTTYDGEFKDDNFNGNGCLKYNNGRKYEGTFKDGKMDGNGKFTWEDGKTYIGNYVNDKKQGQGKLIWNNNKYYEGSWVNNKQHGEGLYFLNGKVLKGQFRFGKIITKNED